MAFRYSKCAYGPPRLRRVIDAGPLVPSNSLGISSQRYADEQAVPWIPDKVDVGMAVVVKRSQQRACPGGGGNLCANTNALAEVQFPSRFGPLVLALIREKLPGAILLTNQLPNETSFPFPSLMETVFPLPPELQALKKSWSDVRAFEGADVGVVLRVVNWGLSGRAGHDPPLSVSLVLKGTLIRVQERVRGRSFYAGYESAKQPFVSWAANGGKPLRDELWRGVESIA